MVTKSQHRLAVILHADVVGSTALVRKDEQVAHDRIQAAFQGFSNAVRTYGGAVNAKLPNRPIGSNASRFNPKRLLARH